VDALVADEVAHLREGTVADLALVGLALLVDASMMLLQ